MPRKRDSSKRDYKKEYQYDKEKYHLIRVKLDKDIAEQFIAKLKEDDETITTFLKRKIYEYLKS